MGIVPGLLHYLTPSTHALAGIKVTGAYFSRAALLPLLLFVGTSRLIHSNYTTQGAKLSKYSSQGMYLINSETKRRAETVKQLVYIHTFINLLQK